MKREVPRVGAKDQPQRGRKIGILCTLILLGLACGTLLHYPRTLIHVTHVEGIIGVLVGLYICSHPAANVVDLLFYGRFFRSQSSLRWPEVLWLALNTLVFMTGSIVIFLGTTRLIGKGD